MRGCALLRETTTTGVSLAAAATPRQTQLLALPLLQLPRLLLPSQRRR